MAANRNGRDGRSFLRAYGVITSFAFNLIAGILIGYYAGGYLDRWLGTDPWLTLILMTLGTLAAFQSLFRELRDTTARRDAGNDEGDPTP